MYYNDGWQLVEEFINDDWSASDPDDEHDQRMQYIWGMRYIDDIAVRREYEAEGVYGPGTLESTWYHCTDTLFSTVAILDDAANLIERVSYDAYGNARHHRMADMDGDGDVDTLDTQLPLIENWNDYGIGDINRDGIVNSTDSTIINADVGNAEPSGRISTTDNIIGYAGYVFNAEMHSSGLYTVRHRVYSPDLGRWLTRDPLGYVDGMSLYQYVRSRSLYFLDSSGLNGWIDEYLPIPEWWQKEKRKRTRIRRTYETDSDLTWLERHTTLPPGTRDADSLEEIIQDIETDLEADDCGCLSELTISGHGSPGVAVCGETILTVRDFDLIEDPQLPHYQDLRDLYDRLNETLCEDATIRFVTCETGEEFSERLEELLGPDTTVITYDTPVKWHYFTPTPVEDDKVKK